MGNAYSVEVKIKCKIMCKSSSIAYVLCVNIRLKYGWRKVYRTNI